MRKYDYVLFDLDGTLTDPGEGITNCIASVLESYGIPVPPREELYQFIGPPLKESFIDYFGFTPENAQKAVVLYRVFFDKTGIFENVILPGSHDALRKLKALGYTLVLATSKPETAAKRILEHFGYTEFFDYVCGADLSDVRTAKGDVIAYAMQTAGIEDVNRAIMVGDRFHDVEGARQNGMKCIGVTFGYGTREELEGCNAYAVADSFDEVIYHVTRSDN